MGGVGEGSLGSHPGMGSRTPASTHSEAGFPLARAQIGSESVAATRSAGMFKALAQHRRGTALRFL